MEFIASRAGTDGADDKKTTGLVVERLDSTNVSALSDALQGFIELTVKHVLESVVLSVFLDLIPETLAKLTAHKWVLLFALL